jgi:HD-GYP domain-containing protein (c-di-GMP phosphodiesterase class II)
VTTSLARGSTPVAYDPLPDELIREARRRYARRRLERQAAAAFGLTGAAVAAGVACSAAFLHGGPAFSPWRLALFVILYAGVSRVEFEVGSGSAIPVQLVLVPMLFALPIGLVPAAVALGLVARTLVDRPWPLRDPTRVLPLLGSAAHALGPPLVIGLAGGLPLRWSAWPVYLVALVAQFAFDLTNAILTGLGNRVGARTLLGFFGVVYAVDASLAPVGLAIAFATRDHPELVLLIVPLVGLLRSFARERQRRIDSAIELGDAYRGTALLLGDVIEADDAYTGSHSRDVVDLVVGVAHRLELSAAELRDAEFVALLHDVGKIRVPAEIINKPGPLDAAERAVIETHTLEGERLLEQVGGLLGHIGRIVRSCHERWDGNGYPDRLRGEEIPLIARIVSACDAYSAMTSDRPYRRALPREAALAELGRCSGTQFDPRVVEELLRVEAAAVASTR